VNFSKRWQQFNILDSMRRFQQVWVQGSKGGRFPQMINQQSVIFRKDLKHSVVSYTDSEK
jgi:hypothetical protein